MFSLAARHVMVAVAVVATTAVAIPASAGDPAPYGPVSERTFHWRAGTSIERAGPNCQSNSDWLLVRGAGVASTKSADVTPKMQVWEKQNFPLNACEAPDCYQVYVKVTNKDAPGPRTVTLTSPDGRKLTTTFDVVENAGRCDYPKK